MSVLVEPLLPSNVESLAALIDAPLSCASPECFERDISANARSERMRLRYAPEAACMSLTSRSKNRTLHQCSCGWPSSCSITSIALSSSIAVSTRNKAFFSSVVRALR